MSIIEQREVFRALKTFWGYDQFRPLQGEIVQATLSRQDVLAILPTGAGKSLCFQLPALLQDGLSLVLSPLVALMENQVAALQAKNIAANLFHGERSREQRQQVLTQLAQGQLKLLYLSPESLLTPAIWSRLSQLSKATPGIQSITLDEAHCITQWGNSFRPIYRRLGAVRPALQSDSANSLATSIPIAAFTATADAATQRDIQAVLGLQNPQVFRASPYRKNLSLNLQRVWSPASRRQGLRSFIVAQGSKAGLVYTRSRRESEQLAQWLTQTGHKTDAYHAGLSPEQRRRIEAQWLSGQTPFVICTSAFGMGVDKPDVRWICHFHVPATLAEYLQEIGRAGRDGRPAQTLLLASEPTGWLDPHDRDRQAAFDQKVQAQVQLAQKLIAQIPAQGKLSDLLQQEPQAELALAILHQQQRLVWTDPFHYCLKDAPDPPYKIPSAPQDLMRDYLNTQHCRWQFLLKAFGFDREAQGSTCGHCDRCQSKR